MTETLTLAGVLLFIAALDAMFAGFRASRGRSGLVRHRRADVLASRRGLALGALLVGPVAVAIAADAARSDRIDHYSAAGRAMLQVYLPYGLFVLVALAAYVTFSWRFRFLASAMLLGPLTLVRPLVALVGGGAAWWATRDATVGVLSLAAVAAVLGVEPAAGRRWYASANHGPTA
jgi:hypothetical protein